MNDIAKDFVSNEQREFRFKIGQILASSLSGFIVGFISASIVAVVFYSYLQTK